MDNNYYQGQDERDHVSFEDGTFATVDLRECDDKKWDNLRPKRQLPWVYAYLKFQRGELSKGELVEMYPWSVRSRRFSGERHG